MDSGWALFLGSLIGATVGIMGSVLTAVYAPMLADKRKRNAEVERQRIDDERRRRVALGEVIAELMEAQWERLHAGPEAPNEPRVRCMMATLALGLLLEDGEEGIQKTVVSANLMIEENDHRAYASLTALSEVLPAWRRGSLTAGDASARYDEWFRDLTDF